VTRRPRQWDADALLVRRTAVRVGVWITVAVSILVIVVLIAAFVLVFQQIPLVDLFDPNRHERTVDIGGLDILIGGLILGLLAVALAGILGILATRRAVAPLVDALARQRRFVADASHELRTPLAILDTRLQVLERGMAPDDPNQTLVKELRDDSRNVVGIVNDLLDAVDVTTIGAAAPVLVAPVVARAVASMRMRADERGVVLTADRMPEDAAALIPETSLHRALVALIDNAIKHTPAGGSVRVEATGERGRVAISVADEGSGIRGIRPDQVFDRFARSSDAVDGGGTASTGFGIGLSLVQDTVGRFGGSVEVTSTSAAGTTMTLRLPAPRRA